MIPIFIWIEKLAEIFHSSRSPFRLAALFSVLIVILARSSAESAVSASCFPNGQSDI
jgi:hypothetical protein